MLSPSSRTAALALACGSLLAVSCAQEAEDAEARNTVAVAEREAAPVEAAPSPEPEEPTAQDLAREELATLIDIIGEEFAGEVGISVREVDGGWTTGWNDGVPMPQQSVSKLWVSMTALDMADKGQLDFEKVVTIRKPDLTVFYQPTRKLVLQRGSFTTDLNGFMLRAITESDNTANDVMLRNVGGPARVEEMLAEKKLAGVRFGTDEITKQSRIAGVVWKPEYSIGGAFFDARDKVPDAVRRKAFESYLANPMDGASAAGISNALARLARGELLSEKSTTRLIETMKMTKSGPNRLKGGVPSGWEIAHKTGTGQYFDGTQSGYNDIALIFAPDGTAYAVAVLIKQTKNGVPANMAMMQAVTGAVVSYHEASREAESVGDAAEG